MQLNSNPDLEVFLRNSMKKIYDIETKNSSFSLKSSTKESKTSTTLSLVEEMCKFLLRAALFAYPSQEDHPRGLIKRGLNAHARSVMFNSCLCVALVCNKGSETHGFFPMPSSSSCPRYSLRGGDFVDLKILKTYIS